MAIKIRPLEQKDFPAWLPLWDGNNQGHKNPDVTTETWARIIDKDTQVFGLCAEDNGKLLGLVHYVLHPTTGSLNPAAYMQDVYVDPAHRKKGIARKLVEAVIEHGKREKWARLYWLAEKDNKPAQELYKSLGTQLDFTLHIQTF